MAAPDRNAGGCGAGIAIGAFIVFPLVMIVCQIIHALAH